MLMNKKNSDRTLLYAPHKIYTVKSYIYEGTKFGSFFSVKKGHILAGS